LEANAVNVLTSHGPSKAVRKLAFVRVLFCAFVEWNVRVEQTKLMVAKRVRSLRDVGHKQGGKAREITIPIFPAPLQMN
jgi:hypothetical protein